MVGALKLAHVDELIEWPSYMNVFYEVKTEIDLGSGLTQFHTLHTNIEMNLFFRLSSYSLFAIGKL